MSYLDCVIVEDKLICVSLLITLQCYYKILHCILKCSKYFSISDLYNLFCIT